MKIDYVMTFVNPSDILWKNEFDKYSSSNKNNQTENDNRYGENNLFKFVFRGIHKYLPWINNVILVVSSPSQVPQWINKSTVKIVYHDEFIPKEFLPTFNSCTIECFLHKIPGLSPFFIYGNDDTYITNTCTPGDFFQSTQPKVKIDCHKFTNGQYRENQYVQLCRNMSLLCAKNLNMPIDDNVFFSPAHFQVAYSTSIYKSIFNEFKTYIMNNCDRFRTARNVSQYLFAIYYALATGNKFVTDMNQKYFRVSQNDVFKICSVLSNNRPQLLCINNSDYNIDIQLIHKFTSVFSEKSKYEC